MNVSHFYQFQNRKEGNDYLYFGALLFQQVPKAEFPVSLCKFLHLQHFIRKTAFFLLDFSKLASDRVPSVVLPPDDRLVNGV